eukprot:14230-Heterococcus_DN1.PRE.3
MQENGTSFLDLRCGRKLFVKASESYRGTRLSHTEELACRRTLHVHGAFARCLRVHPAASAMILVHNKLQLKTSCFRRKQTARDGPRTEPQAIKRESSCRCHK